MEKLIVDFIVKVLAPRFRRRFNIRESDTEQEIREALETRHVRQSHGRCVSPVRNSVDDVIDDVVRKIENYGTIDEARDTGVDTVASLSAMSVVQLKAKAKDMALTKYSTLNKQALIQRILDAQMRASSTTPVVRLPVRHISPTVAATVGGARRGIDDNETTALSAMSLVQLKAKAKDMALTKYSTLNKQALIQFILDAQREARRNRS